MAVLVKVVPDGVSTCPLTGLANEPQSITTNQNNREMLLIVYTPSALIVTVIISGIGGPILVG